MKTQTRWAGLRAMFASGLLIAALVVPALAAYAQDSSQQRAADVEMGDENWFYRLRNVPREGPGDLQGGPAGPALGTARGETNLYDRVPPGGSTGETLHVGVVAGQPEARMFLALPTLDLLGEDEEFGDVIITGGEITLTDAGTEHGSRALQTAEMIACPTTEAVFGGRGSDWADMPGFDCATHVPLEPVEGSDPAQFTIDLDPLAPAFEKNPQAQVVAIVEALVLDAGPDDPRAAAPESWHLAVHSKLTCFEDGGAPGEDDVDVDGQNCVEGRPITADLTYRVQTLDVDFDFGDEEAGEFDDAGFDDADAETFDDGELADESVEGFEEGFGDEGFSEEGVDDGDFADEPEVAAESSGGDELDDRGASADDAPQAAGPATEETGVGTPRSLFLLPLLGLGLASMLGYSLSQDPELPAVREGAVSTLMKRRRHQAGGPPV